MENIRRLDSTGMLLVESSGRKCAGISAVPNAHKLPGMEDE